MKKHILLVDDVATNLKCEELILRNQYQVTMVKSGREALECMQTGIPDIVLLDIRMHVMDGYEVLQHMKKDPKTAAVPVMLLTADTEQESEERGIALGAIDFIRKPIEPQLLLERIETVWKMEE